jgi:hypothetical protein
MTWQWRTVLPLISYTNRIQHLTGTAVGCMEATRIVLVCLLEVGEADLDEMIIALRRYHHVDGSGESFRSLYQ